MAQMADAAEPVVERWTYDVNEKAPAFGHAIRSFWGFDPKYINLNHGSLGAPPLPVLKRCHEFATLTERNPDRFYRLTAPPLLNEARKHAAQAIGADHDEVVLIPNALQAITTVLANFEWKEGDVLLGANTSYIAVSRYLQFLGDRSEQPRPDVHTIEYAFPLTSKEILDQFRSEIWKIKQLYPNDMFDDIPNISRPGRIGSKSTGKNKFVVILDSITPMPSVVMPWKEMVKICREEGAWSVVDGAQSVGQELNINVSTAKPDFFITNCHKWLYAKRGCSVLYVPKRNQHIIRSSIPTGAKYVARSVEAVCKNFIDQHTLNATVDLVPFLSITPAVQFRKWLGGEVQINMYCQQLAVAGGWKLAEVLGTEVLDSTGEMIRNMTTVRLPLPAEELSEQVYTPDLRTKISAIFTERLLEEWNAYAVCFFYRGKWWCRCSAQVYNELADFEYVGRAIKKICEEIRETILLSAENNRF
ncbi:PLP-dependent transferase [Daedalea quercina L-15889]|uniref:PLP-dependent transferase n=1 Tax=Daedalea quercina L-15889 TaxID=1314783 RepID=A0A165TJM4_9APHY|nr:PLP-dependent transferase [Daedalea quercina L-15889]